ncbi:TetR family transcriptional regulator [Nocardioides szechwanensis]|uniref:Transcriptional regulator, TetR family n=1 Tax=Nocardioides szechwanensis TaxID=1005944 RepID=A0A1H0EQL5_9ACTN|nr:TetR family transcriptional regulator [Nocardioides szechwanensis]SDN84626.1 transcriptional regulator, TetR family [Nocardioides szechwanensis]
MGVDRVLGEAGVTRATMYRHFSGKQALVVAYLEREDATIRDHFAQAEEAGGSPRELLEWVIDGIVEDASRHHDRGCPFINASAEYPDPESDVRAVVRRQRDWFRATLTALATANRHPDPARAAASLVLLRDALFVGVYLDGAASVRGAFRANARTVAGLDQA